MAPWSSLLHMVLLFTFSVVLGKDNIAPKCSTDELMFTLTQCDENNGRWRVTVPYNESLNCAVPGSAPSPLRLHGCDITCPAGNFYSLDTLKCSECRPGSYSAGSVQTFEDWRTFPSDFVATSEPLTQATHAPLNKLSDVASCGNQMWTAREDFVALDEGQGCLSKLSLEVNIVQSGFVEFEYQYPESSMMFFFTSISAECSVQTQMPSQQPSDRIFPDRTLRNGWSSTKVQLTKGKQHLIWFGISMADSLMEKSYKPIRIRRIDLAGVKYSSSCTPCPAGTYSSSGASRCTECPLNSISAKNAARCEPCPLTQYALPGFTSCFTRKPCTSEDYEEVLGNCKPDGTAEMSYSWNEPKICASDLSGAAELPKPRTLPCPSCPSGMYRFNDTTCTVCDPGQFLNNQNKCQQCDAGLNPVYEYQIDSWHLNPFGVDVFCWAPSAMGCGVNNSGWQMRSDYVVSGYNHEDDAISIMQLYTAGFRKMISTDNFGHLVFDFEIDCKSPQCQLDFLLEDTETYGVIRVHTFSGPQPRQRFNYTIPRNGSFALTWMFVKLDLQSASLPQTKPRSYGHDVVKIYSIKLTNTLDGGAKSCMPCTGNDATCLKCGEKEVWNADAKKCEKCPANSVVSEETGLCIPCGENLIASGKKCIAKCTVEIAGKFIDMTELKGYHQATTKHFFQASGEDYFHLFNISLCEDAPAVCSNTGHDFLLSKRVHTGFICRTTILKSRDRSNATTSVQSFASGQKALAITSTKSFNNLNAGDNFPDYKPEFSSKNAPDFYYFTQASTPTSTCKNGRSTIVQFRCSKNASSQHDIYFPTNCPDGTCDGCDYHLLWLMDFACPICGSPDDYTIIRGECTGGSQNIFYHSKPYCRETNSSSALVKKVPCRAVPYSVQVLIITLTVSGLALTVVVVYLYKSVKKYEYRYMKLVHDASGIVQLQLPESCVDDVDGTQDGDQEDYSGNCDVEFVTPSETVFTKVKKAITKKKDMKRPITTGHVREDEENQLLDD